MTLVFLHGAGLRRGQYSTIAYRAQQEAAEAPKARGPPDALYQELRQIYLSRMSLRKHLRPAKTGFIQSYR
jgi:hypothetical protein